MWTLLFFATLHADTGDLSLDEWDPYGQGEAPDWAVASEVLVVEGGHSFSQAKGELEGTLRGLGYGDRKRSGEWTIYLSDEAWYPKVMLHDSGYMMIKRRGVHFSLPEVGDWGGLEKPLELALCIVQPTACIRVQGLFASRRRLRWKDQQVVDATRTQLGSLQDRIAEDALRRRLVESLESLNRVWREGVDTSGRSHLSSHQERRAWLIERWIEPAANTWGDQVRQQIEGFIDDVVQVSEHPFLAQEIHAANERRKTERPFQPVAPLH